MGDRLITRGVQLVFARIVIRFGVAAYAAHQVGLSIESLSFFPVLGFAKAATTLVGQPLCARDEECARRMAGQATRLGFAIMSVWVLSFIVFPKAWVALFAPDPSVLGYSVRLMTPMGLLQPLALVMVFSGALRGAGETPSVVVAAAIGGWCFRLPLAYLLNVAGGWGMSVVWAAMGVDRFVR